MIFAKRFWSVGVLLVFLSANTEASMYVSPYFSMSSVKSTTKSHNAEGMETVKETATNEGGIRGGVRFWRIMNFALDVGQMQTSSSSFDNQIKDEWNEIDMSTELDPNADNQEGYTVRKKETQNRATVSLALDPSFWIFTLRAKAGVSARQRIIELFENDVLVSKLTPPITYKPVLGAGLGVRLSARIFAMAEYSFYLYEFPKTEPFERQATISFGLSI